MNETDSHYDTRLAHAPLSIGVPGFLTLWAKAKDNPQIEVRGLTGMSSSSTYLMTRNPAIKRLADFTDKDRIAVPA